MVEIVELTWEKWPNPLMSWLTLTLNSIHHRYLFNRTICLMSCHNLRHHLNMEEMDSFLFNSLLDAMDRYAKVGLGGGVSFDVTHDGIIKDG